MPGRPEGCFAQNVPVPFSGESPKSDRELAGKTLFVHCEQGLGDIIQFIRYAALVKERGGRVLVRCQSRMVPLLSRVSGIDEIVAEGDPLPDFDYHIPLLSLPRAIGTTLETIPRQVPYLFPDAALVDYWGKKLARKGTGYRAQGTVTTDHGQRATDNSFATDHGQLTTDSLQVGINWQGNVQFQGDRFRSFPVACFAPLAELPGVQLVSLQKGIAQEQLSRLHGGGHAGDEGPVDWEERSRIRENSGARDAIGLTSHEVSYDRSYPISKIQNPKCLDLGADVDESHGAFMDTAAVMMHLDLIITSDTAIAHLAGALGRPVWVALPYSADWRWLLDRDDSPWYPTMRLYRQKTRGDWAEVFERIKRDLRRLTNQ